MMLAKATILTTEAKETLRKTIRSLRPELITLIADAAKGEYRLALTLEKAQLPESRRCRRERLEACLDEAARSSSRAQTAEANAPAPAKKKAKKASAAATPAVGNAAADRARAFDQAVKESAHTLVNRIVMLRTLEHHGLVPETCRVVTGGWKSAGYANEFVHYAGPLATDDTRGYAALLDVVFAELALDLPGLFGPVGLTPFFPVPASALRLVVEALNDDGLDSAWGDDTSLGWVYQYWNDPEREALDKKISDGGKIEPHEIASKTQMFTERYMVEWLLHNSLGLTWLAMCKKHGWKPDADTVLDALDARRADWRTKRDAGEVALDALMPIAEGLESRWKYWVPQPIPDDAVASARDSIRDVKLLDPACGSGHFLVIAFDLFTALYEEEARHRGLIWSKEEIAESILANNIHGVDIDPRATQIAAAGLWLKAKLYARDAKVSRMNLVAPVFRIAALPKDDPALVRLYDEFSALGASRANIEKLVASLAGVDHLGTLLRVDKAIEALVDENAKNDEPLVALMFEKQRASLEATIASLLDSHSAEADLGLRLDEEQLATGLRFIEIVRTGRYEVVVGNPPYLDTAKRMSDAVAVRAMFPVSKADLCTCFIDRCAELGKPNAAIGLVTIRGWLFLSQYLPFRNQLLGEGRSVVLADLDYGAFSSIGGMVVSTTLCVWSRSEKSVAINATRVPANAAAKAASICVQERAVSFDLAGLAEIPGVPILYWWPQSLMAAYLAAPKLGASSPAKFGLNSGNNTRFLRTASEVPIQELSPQKWARYVKGAAGTSWIEPGDDVIEWSSNGLAVKLAAELAYGSYTRQIRNERFYFVPGIAFTMMGARFAARAHRYPSVIDAMGSSVYPSNMAHTLCVMNRAIARDVLEALNPKLHFQVGDVNRLPVFDVADADTIFARVRETFADHEAARERSSDMRSIGPTAWRYCQEWAQKAVDRADGEPLPPYEPEYEPPSGDEKISFEIGVALGRFGANAEGILDTAPASALPDGILFLGPSDELPDSLIHSAVGAMHVVWKQSRALILDGTRTSLRDWLRKDFFAYHKGVYENRPIYFPLSSEKKSFVAWVSIHRWHDGTLRTVVADHLNPVLRKLEGEISDLNAARASSDKKVAAAADKQFNTTNRLLEELQAFIALVSECAERGAPPADPNDPKTKRHDDAKFHMDLDDGVMINSAALWPLLAPQWTDPKKWWKQLCLAEGKKDYDWSHLARRYFRKRVDDKCVADPSLAVAHGCFWKLHPEKAYAWELRLQDEIRTDFTIDEEESNDARALFLATRAEEATAIEAKEKQRRERKAAKAADADAEAEAESAESELEEADA